jgi:hypothetical protein
VITITAPDGQLLADQRRQYLYTRQGECLSAYAPTGPVRWDFTAMARLWATCAPSLARPTSSASHLQSALADAPSTSPSAASTLMAA